MDYSKKNDTVLTIDVLYMLNIIESNGHRALIVGGAVRNFLMGIEVTDIDIATTALPTNIISIFEGIGISVIPVGIEHGTVIVLYKGKPYEITTLREDVKTFGRHAEVSFTQSFQIDSNRRDFTMNAIYMDKTGSLFDYHGGISDIHERKVVFIGDPTQRIHEDYLRIFRYFRFVAYYGGFKINDEYITIIYSLKENIAKLSLERILSELLKILQLENGYKIISHMKPILDVIFHLQHNSLEICEKIGVGIESMSPVERFCMMIKFSHIRYKEMVRKLNFPRNIKRLLILECEDLESNQYYIENVKICLKNIRKDFRGYYIKYLLVKMYILKIIAKSQIKAFQKELENFCNSEYVDFMLKASDLEEFHLAPHQLGEVMKSTKKIWEKSSNISHARCLEYAHERIVQLLAE